jgi:hypothetical protein
MRSPLSTNAYAQSFWTGTDSPPAPSSATGETAAKSPETTLSTASGEQPSIVEEEDVPKAKNDTNISENPNEATEVPKLS